MEADPVRGQRLRAMKSSPAAVPLLLALLYGLQPRGVADCRSPYGQHRSYAAAWQNGGERKVQIIYIDRDLPAKSKKGPGRRPRPGPPCEKDAVNA